MKNCVLVALLSMTVAGFVQAAGDAAAGKSKAAVCAACHGADGNSQVPSFPKLAGQNERYLVKQMEDIQCGGLAVEEQKKTKCSPRVVPTMAGQLDAMSEQDLADIAAWFASQPASGGQADPALVKRGEAIYRGGIREKGVAACTACHSPTGKGNAPAGYPSLSGQHAAYTAKQLSDYQSEVRKSDGDSKIMRNVAARLTQNEINALAAYIQGLR